MTENEFRKRLEKLQQKFLAEMDAIRREAFPDTDEGELSTDYPRVNDDLEQHVPYGTKPREEYRRELKRK